MHKMNVGYVNLWGKTKLEEVKAEPEFTDMEVALMEGGHSLETPKKFSFLRELELPKSQWVADISNADKHEVSGDLIGLVQAAYGNTPQGSFVNSIKDVIPSDWNVIDFDEDPDVDACVFYRGPRNGERWTGNKIQGIGHDGTRPGKDHAISKVQGLLLTPGWWIESSDAMRATLIKVNVKPVTDVNILKRLFNDPNLRMVDEITYTRKLQGGSTVTETVFGNPQVK